MALYDTLPQSQQATQPAQTVQSTQQVRPQNSLYDPSTQVENDPANVTVESRLTNLLEKDNPYLSQARISAQKYANQRGLLNSTMAATAGEEAAIKSALPIASQDAGYYQNRGLNEQQGQIQTSLYNTQGDISSRLQGEQGDISSRLQAEAAEQERGLIGTRTEATSRLQAESAQQELERQQRQGEIQDKLYRTQGEISQMLAAQGFDYDQTLKQMDIDWQQLDLQSRMQVEYDRLDQDNKDRFDNTINAISDSYMRDYMEIMINPNFESDADRQKAVDMLNEITQSRYRIAGQIAGVELDWGTSETNLDENGRPLTPRVEETTTQPQTNTQTTPTSFKNWAEAQAYLEQLKQDRLAG